MISLTTNILFLGASKRERSVCKRVIFGFCAWVGACICSSNWSIFSDFGFLRSSPNSWKVCYMSVSQYHYCHLPPCLFLVMSLCLMILFYPKMIVWLFSNLSYYLWLFLWLPSVSSMALIRVNKSIGSCALKGLH